MAGKSLSWGPGAETAARRLQQAVRLRAARSEAVGILRSWGADGIPDELSDRIDSNRDSEAARVRAMVDSTAEHSVDPDFET
ncbi:hypothetical protein ACIA8C_42845 [Nocardia sp. NPDC051321]|uniref:hypothetical protein n=1 Tax=Nocardia sp. NPDC051321 TaxID=3364323 RepID=UPI0037A82DDA